MKSLRIFKLTLMKRIFTTLLTAALVILAAAPVSAQDKTIKRKVAIGRFTNETQYGKGIFSLS